jgi:hypothetical protein
VLSLQTKKEVFFFLLLLFLGSGVGGGFIMHTFFLFTRPIKKNEMALRKIHDRITFLNFTMKLVTLLFDSVYFIY